MRITEQKNKIKRIKTTKLAGALGGRTNFEYFYDTFHDPLTDMISGDGRIVGIDKKGELRNFEHTAKTRAMEDELIRFAKERNTELLDAKLLEYFNEYGGAMNEIQKYILTFYKVLHYNPRACLST